MPTGTCLCGDVAWEIDGPFEWMAHCHCAMCRKAHGTAYATFVTFAPERFRWTRGESSLCSYRSSADSARNFCGRCGSKLPALEPFAYAFPGPMEGDFGVMPRDHIFVGSMAPWHVIGDDLPRHDRFPGNAGSVSPTPRHTEPSRDHIRGGCLCGAVAYEIDRAFDGGGIVSCHCTRCRRARGAMHGSNFFVDTSLFRWLRGEDHLVAFKVPDAARFVQSFCAVCGSIMPARDVPPGRRVIPAGSLDDDPGVRSGLHIFVGSRAPWEIVSGPFPQHDTYPSDGVFPLARAREPVT